MLRIGHNNASLDKRVGKRRRPQLWSLSVGVDCEVVRAIRRHRWNGRKKGGTGEWEREEGNEGRERRSRHRFTADGDGDGETGDEEPKLGGLGGWADCVNKASTLRTASFDSRGKEARWHLSTNLECTARQSIGYGKKSP